MTEVTEAYKDYSPPDGTRKSIEELLQSVPKEQLAGLKNVVLTNAEALTGARKRRWSWSRGRKVRHGSQVAGLYHHASKTEPAWVEIFVEKAYAGIPSWALRVSFVRGATLGSVLYHEVGHHIHATQTPEHREREAVADAWKHRLSRLHVRRRHSVISLLFRPVAWLRGLRRSSH